MPEENRFKNSNFAEVYGELQRVHRVRRSLTDIYLPLGALLFLLAFGVITYVAADDRWTFPCCVVLPLLLFILAAWHLFSTRRDELRIYEHGFTYQSGGNLQACLWSEIETCTPRERTARELAEPAADAFPLGWIEKRGGARIAFDPDVPGTPEIAARFERQGRKST